MQPSLPMRPLHTSLMLLLIACVSSPFLRAQSPPYTSLTVYPNSIDLASPNLTQQLIVLANHPQHSIDVTSHVTWTPADPNLFHIHQGRLVSRLPGEAHLEVSWQGLSQSVAVHIGPLAEPPPISFEHDVQAALTKQGCNSGACHGSPSGKGSFRLSLRGFDSKLDRFTLAREEWGRRLNLLDVDQSLLLLKPLMKAPHGGGMKLHLQDPTYHVLRNWIIQGAKFESSPPPTCVRLEVLPGQDLIRPKPHWRQQLAVIAHYADGSRRDVTDLACFEVSASDIASIQPSGLLTGKKRGETSVLVRYLEQAASIRCFFQEEVDGFQWTTPTSPHRIDQLVDAKLKSMQILPSDLCSDTEFLRRVFLDTIGIPPTPAEVESFLANPDPDKRTLQIDQLLARPEYAKFWALKWGDLLRMTSKKLGEEGLFKYHRWLENAFASNMPYDQFARELLLATGSTYENPAANFYRAAADRDDCVESVSQIFLGARLQCAKCHNHPFERWTQDNYYGLGAFFESIKHKKASRPNEWLIWYSSNAKTTQPRTGQVVAPWLPGVGPLTSPPTNDPRSPFVDWLTQPGNPYFAKMEANRIWSHCFARGIVDPVDDFRDSNPPTNPELLESLAATFEQSQFDRKQLLKSILTSRTYQASSTTNPSNADDTKYFSHQIPRLLAAEQLLDAVDQAMNLPRKFANLPAGTKSTQLPSPDLVKIDFLKTFGQPERASVCACERSHETNLGMAIEFFNGSMLHDAIHSKENGIRALAAAKTPVDQAVDALFLAITCRKPLEQERKLAIDFVQRQPQFESGLEDLAWALFNSDEFLFQH